MADQEELRARHDATGIALPDETIASCMRADAVLLGAVGGPAWDDPSARVRPEQGLHLRFVQDNLWGEWFSQSYELIEYIADHTQDVRTYYALNSPTLSARYLAGLDDFRPTLWLYRITTTPGSGVAEDDAE